MANWFRMTTNKSLDRRYLRISAVYRCMKRYGADKAWALTRLRERGLSLSDATALISGWRQVAGFPGA